METQRLILRERTLERIHHIRRQTLQEQMAFFGIHTTEELAKEQAKLDTQLTNGKTQIKWDLILKTNPIVVGNCGFHNINNTHQRAELGYYLHPQFRKEGYMQEALELLISIGFTTLHLHRIEAYISPPNLPSIHLIQKLGFKKEGLLRNHYHFEGKIYDSSVYGLLVDEHQP